METYEILLVSKIRYFIYIRVCIEIDSAKNAHMYT